MSAGRGAIAAGVILLSSLPAVAQQGYEFGIRFQPLNFRSVNFGGFSFQQASPRPVNNQPIQFDRITFPAFNSRATQRDANQIRGVRPDAAVSTDSAGGRHRRPVRIAVKNAKRRLRPESAGRSRLALDSPGVVETSRVRRPGAPPSSQSTRFAYSVKTGRMSALSSGSSAAGRRGGLSRSRRRVLAERFEEGGKEMRSARREGMSVR